MYHLNHVVSFIISNLLFHVLFEHCCAGMASSGSLTRPPCTDEEDMPDKRMEASLDKKKDAHVKTPTCWCGDVCLLKVSTDRKKAWTEGRRYFICPNYAHDRATPTNAYDNPLVC